MDYIFLLIIGMAIGYVIGYARGKANTAREVLLLRWEEIKTKEELDRE